MKILGAVQCGAKERQLEAVNAGFSCQIALNSSVVEIHWLTVQCIAKESQFEECKEDLFFVQI